MGCPCPTGLCTGRFLDIYVRGRGMYHANIKLLRLSLGRLSLGLRS